MNFLKRDGPLVIARMSASIAWEPVPMSEFFLVETVPPLLRTNRDSGGVFPPTGAAHPRSGMGERDRGGADEESLLDYAGEHLSNTRYCVPPSRTLAATGVGRFYLPGLRDPNVHDSPITSC